MKPGFGLIIGRAACKSRNTRVSDTDVIESASPPPRPSPYLPARINHAAHIAADRDIPL